MTYRVLTEYPATTPREFPSDRDRAKFLRTYYPDRIRTDVAGLFRVPSGGFIHVYEESDDALEATS